MLYVLDEPSAGLHADEIVLLVEALRVLVRSGGSVLFVDHDLSLIAASDWVIELGPGGGKHGGELVFEGTPQELTQSDTKTGLALAQASSGKKSRALPKKKTKKKAQVLSVRGANEHTLREVSVEIPHQQMTLVTGPSGSGKSTLAFDVVFAEGQRRFLETLTPYARRFLPTLPRPSVDTVDGVPPSIALEQRTTRVGARSTVATVTEVAHYLRLAFAKLGTPYCPDHDQVIERRSEEELFSLLSQSKKKGALLAQAVKGRKGSYLDLFTSAAQAGIVHAVADGKRVECDKPPRLAKSKEHDIALIMKEEVPFSEITLEEFKRALTWGSGNVLLHSGKEEKLLS